MNQFRSVDGRALPEAFIEEGRKGHSVAIVVPTYNEEANIARLLTSIQMQTGVAFEVAVVDQESTDRTVEIAKSYGCAVITDRRPPFYTPPGRSRNLGVRETRGEILLHLDADMELPSRTFLGRLCRLIDDAHQAAIVHELDVSSGFWASCKALERRCYWGTDLEAARVVTRGLFDRIGGYDSSLSSGEDFYISNLFRQKTSVVVADDLVLLHHVGSLSLRSMLGKKFRYGKTAGAYLRKVRNTQAAPVTRIISRSVGAYLRNIRLLPRDPVHYICVLPLRVMEFFAISLGMLFPLRQTRAANGRPD